MDGKETAKNIDEFIMGYPPDVQEILQQLRATIQRNAPDAKETISYGIPTFTLKGNLVHFSAYKKHVGFYPGAEGIAAFAAEFSKYETSKGTVRFPIEQPIPNALIEKVVQYRVQQNLAKAEAKLRQKKKK